MKSIKYFCYLVPYLIIFIFFINIKNLLSQTVPETPLIFREISPVGSSVQKKNNKINDYTRAIIPPFNTSLDGRLALSMESVNLDNFMEWNLNVPEKITAQLMSNPNKGSVYFAYPNNYFYNIKNLKNILLTKHRSKHGQIKLHNSHHSICEGRTDNPRTCGKYDCYDLFLLLFSQEETNQRIWKIPATIQIENPKTLGPKINGIFFDETKIEHALWPFKAVFEPVVTRDGRLIVARADGSKFTWHRSKDDAHEPNAPITNAYDIFFAYSKNPCDIHEWSQNFFPIAYANSHPIVNKKYGFAFNPLKDTEGNIISDTKDLPATYPWIDREGKNIFFSPLNTSLYYRNKETVRARFPSTCLPDIACIDPTREPINLMKVEPERGHQGFAYAGLWSNGKTILLDGLLSHSDFALGLPSDRQRMVKLYKPRSDRSSTNQFEASGNVRIAAGRDQRAYMPGGVDNTTIPNSLQNIFNYYPHMKPISQRDIVWLMSKGHVSDEVIFDDFIDPHVVIFSEMLASWTQGDDVYHDGWHTQNQKYLGFLHTNENSAIKLQNSSNSKIYPHPKHGVVYGPARIEPVALGGVRGRGFWMTEKTKIKYALNSFDNLLGWYVGLFVDSRVNYDGWQKLIEMPTDAGFLLALNVLKSQIGLFSYDSKKNRWENLKIIQLSHDIFKAWMHLGIHHPHKSSNIDIFINGKLINTINTNMKFSIKEGNLEIGGTAQNFVGYQGWLDELKLIIDTGQFSNSRAEIFCNHAHGTIIGTNKKLPTELSWNFTNVSKYITQELITRKKQIYKNYLCLVNYKKDYDLQSSNTISDAKFLRDDLIFPEGPLQWDKPRPNSITNQFCQNCHVDFNGQLNALTSMALRDDSSVTAHMDKRRQPHQPPAAQDGKVLITGHPPITFVKNYKFVSPINIDQILYPNIDHNAETE